MPPPPPLRLDLHPVAWQADNISRFRYIAQGTPVFGREEEQAALRRFLDPAHGRFRWWLLGGPGGMGKSRKGGPPFCGSLRARRSWRRPSSSLFFAIIDADSGQTTYTNAGHPLPWLIPDDGGPVRSLGGEGGIVGVLEDLKYPQETMTLAPGGLLFICTDASPKPSTSGANSSATSA